MSSFVLLLMCLNTKFQSTGMVCFHHDALSFFKTVLKFYFDRVKTLSYNLKYLL